MPAAAGLLDLAGRMLADAITNVGLLPEAAAG
jgi:hypothetical protein